MRHKIKDIAKLQTGLFAKPEQAGNVTYLQVKHFDENGHLQEALHPDLKANKVTEKHLLKQGDILFAAKGAKNFAAIYESHNPPAVASTSFFVIRLYQNGILPAYLAWYLNHPTTMTFLKEQAIGSSIVSISKTVLDELEIPVPSVEQQQAILHIASLQQRESWLYRKIEALREQLIQQQIFNTLK
ncbi:type I restriction modification DNA specificity protein [Lacibacter cauensis]|uniref:Type I restriction modification DNA specificity protein n=1 Tax=Lacibacter cauensis TaxID=510947 RepID=A0A562SCE7_9BACT|nr:restriction endonuclease subunit S [Lacibacter cauensis]TWI79032.1 type I restriction modification DNA specificity protein [Lacibacter cauensis]